MANEENNTNLLTDFYFPIRDQEKIYSSNAYKVLSENNVDTAQLLGVNQDPNSHSIQLRNDSDPTFQEKVKSNATDFAKGVVNFISDVPNEIQMKSVEGLMQAGKFGVNLLPIVNKLAGSPYEENTLMENAISWNKSLNKQITQFRDIYKQGYQISEGREPSGFAEFAGWIAQDYPYSAGIYKGLKKVGIPDGTALILSVGLGTAISFDPKETSVSLNLFTQEIDSLKKYLEIIPDTPDAELFDRAVQFFEGTAFAKAIPHLIDTAKFLKRNIPAFVPGAAVSTAATTAIDQAIDATIVNPKEQIIPQTTDGLNQDQSLMDTIKGGVDQFGNKLTEIGGAIKKEFSGDAMAKSPITKVIDEFAPIFKSTVIEAVDKIPNKAPGNQILGTIKNIQGVSQSEIKWIGLDDFLKDKPSVTKQEVSDFIQANRLDVNEVQFPRKATGEPSKTYDELEKLLEPHSEYAASAVYEYQAIKEALHNNLNVRYDSVPYIKKGSTKDSVEYSVKIDVNDFLDKTGLWDGIYETSEVWGRNFFKESFKNAYHINSLRQNGQSLDNNLLKEYFIEAKNNDILYQYRNFDNLEASDFSNLIFSETEFKSFQNFLKTKNVGIEEYATLKMSDNFTDKIYNEYLVRASNENLDRYDIDFSFIQELDGGGSTAKFQNQTLPGGRDYKELVFTLSKGGENVGFDFPLQQGATKRQTTRELGIPISQHMNVPGEFAHVRFKTRNINGQKTLSVEEMQSDIFQGVKQENKLVKKQAASMERTILPTPSKQIPARDIIDEAKQKASAYTADNTITDFPFKNNWYELATRRLIRYAADNDFSAIAIPEGKVAAARYGKTGGFVDNVEVKVGVSDELNEAGYPNYTFYLTQKRGMEVVEERALKDGAIYDIDKTYPKNYQDILADAEDILLHRYNVQELENKTFKYKLSEKQFIGEGKGKFELYDQAIPAYMKKYAKKWNAPVTTEQVKFIEQNETINYSVLKITPEMKRSVQEKSQPLFNIVGPALAAGGGAKAVSDSMRNNIISEPTKNQ